MSISPGTRDRLTASIAQLIRLEQDGDQRCSALAARAGVDVSVASRQLAVLERSGYVERHPDPRDGRAALLRLTAPGAARRLTDLLDRLRADIEVAVPAPRTARPEPHEARR